MMRIVDQTEWEPVTRQAEGFVEPNDEENQSGILDTSLTLFGRNLGRAERAESFVVGCTVKFRDQAILAVEQLRPDQFVFKPAQIVFRAVCELVSEGREVDKVNVLDAILRAKQAHNFPQNNPGLYLVEISDYAGGAAGFEYHLGLVRDLSARRGLMQTMASFEECLGSREPVSAIAQRFGQEILCVQGADARSKVVSIAESGRRVMQQIDNANREGGRAKRGLETGFNEIDDSTGGLAGGHLVVLAARPSVGKSALAGLIARNVAAGGKRVLFFSLEMSETELTERIVAALSGVPLQYVKGAKRLDANQADRIFRVVTEQFPKMPFSFVDRRGITATELAIDARSFARANGGVDLIVCDYLQLLKPENHREPRHLQVGAAAKTLRNLAGELKCPILCLAQLNREQEQRGGEPRLSDLRDSGEIEQDSDIVFLLHRTSTDTSLTVQDVDLIIAKNRGGPTGKVGLSFNRTLTKFSQRSVAP